MLNRIHSYWRVVVALCLAAGAMLWLVGCEVPQPRPVRNGRPITYVVAFGANWCQQCRRDKPTLDRLRRQGVSIRYYDADQRPDMMQRYHVQKLPDYIVVQDSRIVYRTPSATGLVSFLVTVIKIAAFILR